MSAKESPVVCSKFSPYRTERDQTSRKERGSRGKRRDADRPKAGKPKADAAALGQGIVDTAGA